MINDLTNKELTEYFLKNKIKVHISKTNGIFYNGIISYVGVDFFIIDDFKEGKKIIMYGELAYPIEEYLNKGNKNKK